MERTAAGAFSSHREEREAGLVVYPVHARRSGGLSLGINLFPEGKRCDFDCPYCEVFPFEGESRFSRAALEAGLEAFARGREDARSSPSAVRDPVRDLCLSGNGEPTLSPHLEAALEACAAARRAHPEVLGGARLVLITNSTGFLDPGVSALLARWVDSEDLDIWAKLDAGTEEGFAAMSRSRYRLAEIAGAIEDFARATPVTLQSMVCSLRGREADPVELEARASLVAGMAARGARFRQVQLYTVARPSPESIAGPVADGVLRAAASLFRARLEAAAAGGGSIRVRCFGEGGEL